MQNDLLTTRPDTATRLAHHELARRLSARFDQTRDRVNLGDVTGTPMEARNYDFTSAHTDVHPADPVSGSDPTFRALVGYFLERSPFSNRHFRELQTADREVEANKHFRYSVFVPDGRERSSRAIVLLHGLNEKFWDKYLPWAFRLAERTRTPVILMPIAFHMNRAPAEWANPREMMGVVTERRRLFPHLAASSFANVALSHRVQFAPHRFISSGLQSFLDVTDLASQIASGRHPLFEAGARVDLFGYSIGASLAQALLMGGGPFAESRAVLFCGGALMDRSNPVSKAIIDAEAYRSLTAFLSRLAVTPATTLAPEIAAAERHLAIADLFSRLVFLEHRRPEREELLAAIGQRVSLLAMHEDEVFPPDGIAESWRTAAGRELAPLTVLEPRCASDHVHPFPTGGDDVDAADEFFTAVMDEAASHFGGG